MISILFSSIGESALLSSAFVSTIKSIILWIFGLEESQLSDGSVLAGIIATFVVIAAILWLMSSLSFYRVFKKKEISGSKAFIPFYNAYILYKLLFGKGLLFLLGVVPFVNVIVYVIARHRIARLYGKGIGWTILLSVLGPFGLVSLTYSESGKKVWNRGKLIIQSCFFILTNSFMVGWFKGDIYKGNLKYICVPGMNCYSCPGAFGSCPIGALQAVLNEFDAKKSWFDTATGTYVKAPMYWFAFYVIGFIMIIGALCGRLICGLLCPFGWVQDLLHKIPTKKIKLPRDERLISRSKHAKGIRFALCVDKGARYLKYAMLVVMVIILPLIVKADPWFCKYICPSGMLIGGVPLISLNSGLAESVGSLTALKLCILGVLVALSIFIYRPFCKYICPLGALYAIMNPISLYRYGIVDSKCNRSAGCAACSHACKMGVDIVKTPNNPECIRCGDCKSSCPNKAIKSGFRFKTADGNVIRTGRKPVEKFNDSAFESEERSA